MKLLIVDEDVNSVILLKKLIRSIRPDCMISTATDGYSAYISFLKAIESPFDIVITEQYLAELHGDELARKIKILNPEVKVICLSSDTLYNKEFDIILTKPLTRRIILETIIKLYK